MKRILFILGLFIPLAVFGQSTIKDYGDYITLNYSNGDTVSVGKANIAAVHISNTDVYIMTNQQDHRTARTFWMRPANFGYGSAELLRAYVAAVAFGMPTESYSTDGNGIIDTIWYISGSDTSLIEVYTNDGTYVTGKSVLPQ
jgi:hypothetical protein